MGGAASSSRINNVQALRGFAAMLVVLGHTELLPFGTFGVDIFFVISGYIMAMIVDRNPEKFFLRRLIRILPLYWTATLLVFLLAAWKPNLMIHTRANFRELLLSLMFIPFFKNGSIYYANPVLFVGWTLNFEMFFYVVLAICLRVRQRRAVLMASIVIVCAMAICRVVGWHTGWRYAFSIIYGDSMILEFVLGMASYSLVRRISVDRARRLRIPAFALLTFTALLMTSFQATHWWPAIPAMFVQRLYLFGIPSFLMIASAGCLSKGGADTQWKWLVLLGDASYVIYILHSYVLDGMDRVLAKRVPMLHINRPVGGLLSMSIVVALSILLYLKAERPAVDWLSVRFGTRRVRKQEVADPAESMA